MLSKIKTFIVQNQLNQGKAIYKNLLDLKHSWHTTSLLIENSQDMKELRDFDIKFRVNHLKKN